MPNYAKHLRNQYNEGKINKEQLIRGVYVEASNRTIEEGKVATRGIKSLFELSQENGSDIYIPIKDIYAKGAMDTNQSPTAGLYVWLDDKGCGVVEKQAPRVRKYRIKKEFYVTLQKVLESTP